MCRLNTMDTIAKHATISQRFSGVPQCNAFSDSSGRTAKLVVLYGLFSRRSSNTLTPILAAQLEEDISIVNAISKYLKQCCCTSSLNILFIHGIGGTILGAGQRSYFFNEGPS